MAPNVTFTRISGLIVLLIVKISEQQSPLRTSCQFCKSPNPFDTITYEEFAAMSTNLALRAPMPDDALEMLEVQKSAFSQSTFILRCYPASDPRSDAVRLESIYQKIKLKEITLACDESGRILGWSRWERRPVQVPKPPRPVIPRHIYPPEGDPDLAMRYFQANFDKTYDAVGDENMWFLGMIVVRPDAQNKGVGSALMEPGIVKADEDGWGCWLNGTDEGKKLYEKFGFRTVDASRFEHGIVSYHMKREARNAQE